jgi:hypothetical protein
MRQRTVLPLAALCFAAWVPSPASAAPTACGGSAPGQVACATPGTIGRTGFVVGCRSTAGFTGYVNVTFGTSTGDYSRTCYFAAGELVAASDAWITGRFRVGQMFWIDGDGVGSGGWEVYTTA